MKKLLVLIIVVLISNINFAQYEQVGWVSKFGIAGGITPTWIIPNLDDINSKLPAFGVDKLPTSGTFALGGSGYAYVLFIDNLRIGGLGFGGSVSENAVTNGFRKEVSYSYGIGALTIEYTLPFVKGFAVSVGTLVGAGSVELELHQNKGEFDWNNVWAQVSDTSQSTQNISRSIKNGFFTLAPTINIDIPLNRFIAFRIGGGYIFSLGNDWEIANEQSLNNVPSSFNGDSFFIQTGIFLGFFAF